MAWKMHSIAQILPPNGRLPGYTMRIDDLKRNFHLMMVVVFCLITVLGITPFAFYRFANGHPLLALVDLVIVASISFGSIHSLRSGRSQGTAIFIALTYSAGCIAVAYLDPFAGLLWVFPVLIANFLLVPGWRAVAISGGVILGVGVFDAALSTTGHITTYAVTTVVVSLFACIFAWRSEQLRQQLESIALHDPLTGASNRRGMQSELEIAMSTSSRSRLPLGLLVFDLDHFKQINHSFGHEAGDHVLIQVVRLVRQHTRKDDRFFRVGGEEFALLVPGADVASLREIAEKLRLAVEFGVNCHGRVVTISVGATRYCTGETAATWQARADAAMYQAKHNGRNCWVVDDTCNKIVDTARHPLSSPRRPALPERRIAA